MLVNASFRFLLEREPKESILGHFAVSDIERFLPRPNRRRLAARRPRMPMRPHAGRRAHFGCHPRGLTPRPTPHCRCHDHANAHCVVIAFETIAAPAQPTQP